MKFLKYTIALIAILSLTTAHAQEDESDKIGTVNMQRLLADFHKTKALNKTFEGYQEEIQGQDVKRQEEIKAAAEEAKKLQQDAKDVNLSDEERSSLFRQSTAKQREAQGLLNDRSSWVQRKRAALNDQAKLEYGKLREEIMEIVNKVGDEEGFDYIFDNSGASGAGVSILVFTRDASDLTGMLIERINQDAPEE